MADIVRAGALWGYAQLTQHMEYDPGSLLAEVDLSLEELDNPDTYLSRPAVVALLELTAAKLKCPDFGMRLAGVQDVNILGALAFAVRNAPDLHHAIGALERHIHYQSQQATLSIEPVGDTNEDCILFRAPLTANDRQMSEHAISLFCRVVSHLTGDQVRPTRIMFAHEPLLPPSRYAEYLEGIVPTFGASDHCVCMDRDALAFPMATVNRRLQVLVESYLESCGPSPAVSITNRTYEALVQLMRFGPASIEDVSDMLRMHPRTLQRRLADDGITFERLRDEIRKEMAERHLSNVRVPLAEVASALGYANQSALARSCARWFGRSPKTMRHHLRTTRHAS
jgi:AraC-like DNA-binding protein